MKAQQRVAGRDKLLHRIIQVFAELEPVAIHQFGSGASGYRDEWSDIDLWLTFDDHRILEILKSQRKIFDSIASIVIVHSSKKNSPVGGSANLVIFETEEGLFQVDFYIAPRSKSVILQDAKLLYGEDSLPRGHWQLDKDAKERKTLSKDVTFLIVMSFILIKGVIRKWERSDLEELINKVYQGIQQRSGKKLQSLPTTFSFEFIEKLLTNLEEVANASQRKAIKKIQISAKDLASPINLNKA